jgi:hypothetical protein
VEADGRVVEGGGGRGDGMRPDPRGRRQLWSACGPPAQWWSREIARAGR